jgi:V8-like Glu-specific endopeptidase
MEWNDNLTALNYLLASLYPSKEDTFRLADEAGIPRHFVAFRDRAIDNIHSLIEQANNRGKIGNLIRVARKDHGDLPGLISAEQGALKQDSGPVPDSDLPWRGSLSADTIEKIMGQQSTLLPIGFLELGLRRSRAVALLSGIDGVTGTGFLIPDNILVTNNHVIPDMKTASSTVSLFNYQENLQDRSVQPIEVALKPEDGFETSEDPEEDWTLVRVSGDANSQWGAIPLRPIDVTNVKYVNIIQHPGGRPKELGCYHNVVVYVDDYRVQYLTDTEPGSSGSPVFDSSWQLVALHHSGGWIRQPGLRELVYRNEGININRVVVAYENRFR